MAEFDALRILGSDEMPPRNIKMLRANARVSQTVFAAVLNTSVPTVQKWEISDEKPSPFREAAPRNCV